MWSFGSLVTLLLLIVGLTLIKEEFWAEIYLIGFNCCCLSCSCFEVGFPYSVLYFIGSCGIQCVLAMLYKIDCCCDCYLVFDIPGVWSFGDLLLCILNGEGRQTCPSRGLWRSHHRLSGLVVTACRGGIRPGSLGWGLRSEPWWGA